VVDRRCGEFLSQPGLANPGFPGAQHQPPVTGKRVQQQRLGPNQLAVTTNETIRRSAPRAHHGANDNERLADRA
jgi:hypothetical protein